MMLNFTSSLTLVLCVLCIAITQNTFAQSSVHQKNADKRKNLFPLTLIHVNDIHARFDETNWETGTCKTGEICIGGYARVVGTVRMLQRTRSNPIYLNAGDNFAGTIWYSVGRWNVTAQMLNLHNADVITLGNHEFDHGVEGVVPFIDRIEAPLTLANVDVSQEPSLQGKLKDSVILTRDGRQIGVIGVLNMFTNETAITGNIVLLDETEVVRNESLRLKERGVDIIIVLSHAGLDRDYLIAADCGPHVDVIVGAHTHSFLYTGSNPPGPDTPVDEYPAVITQADGHKVLIVQASSYAKYVGDLTVYFDQAGNAVRWKGAPIFMGPDVPQDKQILDKLLPWKRMFDDVLMRSISYLNKTIVGTNCHSQECEMGDIICDAYRQYHIAQNQSLEEALVVTILNSGGIRASLEQGPITYGDISAVQPFSNSADSLDLTGQDIIDVLEVCAERAFGPKLVRNLLQVSGLKITYNRTNTVGSRVVSVETQCRHCGDESEDQYQPIDRAQIYRVITSNFMANGGDGFTLVSERKRNHVVGPIDLDVLLDYFEKTQTMKTEVDGRITILE